MTGPVNYRHYKRERLRYVLQTDECLRTAVRNRAIALMDKNAPASVRLAMLLAAPGTFVIMAANNDVG